MKIQTALTVLLALASTLAVAAPEASPTHAVMSDQTTPRLIVKYRAGTPSATVRVLSFTPSVAGETKSIAQRARYNLMHVKVGADGAVVYHLGKEVTIGEAQAIAARIAADPTVEYAEPDVRVKAFAATPVTSDTYSYQQWPLMARTAAAGGSNFAAAWQYTKGANIIVGVIDTGALAHPDLVGQTVPGYDFVSTDADGRFTSAGDGNGRDSDETDPGDYCTSTSSDSTWHGIKVASQIVGIQNNNYGVSGGAPSAKVMHLRAIGRCGGFMSDIADAMSWSVGIHIAGVPDNTRPVQVVNISLGASVGTACSASMQTAVNAATSRNVPVVVAAGNESATTVGAPANCTGVIVVGAHTKSADLAGYSNRSASLTVTAPGGGYCATQSATCLNDPTVAAGNYGTTVAAAAREADYFSGTSAAAPQVTSVVALLLAVKPTLTPAEIKTILMNTAKPHAADSYCAQPAHAGVCGAGMLDAGAAVASIAPAITPVASIAASFATSTIVGKAPVTLAASVSGALGSSYVWTQTSGTPVVMSGANTATMTFTAPATATTMVFKVTVSTAISTTITATSTVSVNNPPAMTTLAFSIAAGANANMALVSTDLDGDAVVLTLVDGPAGLTLSGTSLVWTPTAAGSYVANVLMTDARGLASTQAVTITVAAATGGGTGSTGSTPGGTTSGSSGGGGSMDLAFLALLASGIFAMSRRAKAQA